MAQNQINVIPAGIQGIGSGTQGIVATGDRQGAALVSELHSRLYQLNALGALYSGGMALTSISNATFAVSGIAVTTTPVIGVWNPPNSAVNLEIIQASLGITVTAATSTGAAPFVWCTSIGNGVISTGNVPLNRKTLLNAGSLAKDMTGVALTGITTNIATKFGSSLGGGSLANFSFVGTAVGQVTPYFATFENFDGSLIVPPGGVLALLTTATAVAHSAVSSILWAEIPV